MAARIESAKFGSLISIETRVKANPQLVNNHTVIAFRSNLASGIPALFWLDGV